ncbi:aminotransferase class V-fold PLP-dependent enzyme, partial [Neptunomonas phycophila]|uniref:aminotransferase class V-fold PLP-dependent enzyme n=1 Tax=Neptunomonas phycophila TaxID=1572645 RepID=UPI0023F8EF80
MFDVSRIRRDFPILSSRVNGKPLVYLDNAATTHKPRVVMDSVARFYKLQNSNVHRGSHTLSNAATTEFENARKIAASFIGSPDPAHVIWTKGATEAANLLAYSLGDLLIKPEDVILVSMMEHHANLV